MDRRDLLLGSGVALAAGALSSAEAAAPKAPQATANKLPPNFRPGTTVQRHRIIRDFKRPDPALLEKLKNGGTGGVSSPFGFLDRYLCDTAIKPVRPDMRIFGTAFTIDIPEPDLLIVSYAMKLAKPGDVLVINAHGNTRVGCFGLSMAQSCLNRGIVGAIIDGATMDVEWLRSETPYAQAEEKRRGLALPVYARALTEPYGDYSKPGSINVPIQFGGLSVSPGDLVLGRRDGIFIVPQSRLADLLQASLLSSSYSRAHSWLPRVKAGELWYDIHEMDNSLAYMEIPQYETAEEADRAAAAIIAKDGPAEMQARQFRVTDTVTPAAPASK